MRACHLIAIETVLLVGLGVKMLFFSGPTGPAVARDVEPMVTCAARDLQFVTLLEQHGDAQDVAADRLAEAFFTALKARAACSEGRIAEAIAIYDSIAFRPAQRAEGRNK
jgi:hypothetical protein